MDNVSDFHSLYSIGHLIIMISGQNLHQRCQGFKRNRENMVSAHRNELMFGLQGIGEY